ncbi:MAG: hypothetical protein NTX53_14005 [candidate division WOR-3 bacterium]|nr:hypothetical protein [candidate division WOR-3 bacterium]
MRYTASDSSSLHMLIPRQFRALVTVVAVTASVCLAGYWEFEQVDIGSIGSHVAIDKMSDGTVWLAYVNRHHAIRLAHKDSVWEYEDLDAAIVRPDFQSGPPFSFDIGLGDVIGVVGQGRLAERRDSVWSSESLPMPMRDLALSYDPAGRPSLTFTDSLWQGCLGVRADSGWDTDVVFVPSEYTWAFSLTRPAWRRDDNCALIEADVWSMGGLIDGYGVSFKRRDSGVWTDFGGLGGLDGGGCGFAALPDSSDSIHTFWSAGDNYYTNKLVCDDVVLDRYTSIGAACLDDSGRVQCAWVRDDNLKFALVPESTLIVGDGVGINWCDITTDTLSQPVIAYCGGDGSIYVAHGVGVAGLSNEPREAAFHSLRPSASIITNVLFLPRDMTELPGNSDRVPRPTLLDAAGRKVVDLHAGANDVSSLAPGIYFVREAQAQAQAQAVRKVVITR